METAPKKRKTGPAESMRVVPSANALFKLFVPTSPPLDPQLWRIAQGFKELMIARGELPESGVLMRPRNNDVNLHSSSSERKPHMTLDFFYNNFTTYRTAHVFVDQPRAEPLSGNKMDDQMGDQMVLENYKLFEEIREPAKLILAPERENGGYFKRTGLNPYSTIVVEATEASLQWSGHLPSHINSTCKIGYLDFTLETMKKALNYKTIIECAAGPQRGMLCETIFIMYGQRMLDAYYALLTTIKIDPFLNRRHDLGDLKLLIEEANNVLALIGAVALGFSPPDGSELTWLRGNREGNTYPMLGDFAIFSILCYHLTNWEMFRSALGPEEVWNSRAVYARLIVVDHWVRRLKGDG